MHPALTAPDCIASVPVAPRRVTVRDPAGTKPWSIPGTVTHEHQFAGTAVLFVIALDNGVIARVPPAWVTDRPAEDNVIPFLGRAKRQGIILAERNTRYTDTPEAS